MQANVGDEQPVLNEDEDIIEDMGDADMVDQVLYYVAGLWVSVILVFFLISVLLTPRVSINICGIIIASG